MSKYVSKHEVQKESPQKKASDEKRTVNRNNIREKHSKLPIYIISAVVLVMVFLAAASVFITKSDKNLPNVHIGDVDVGGLTSDETAEKLGSYEWDKKTQEKLTVVTFGGIQYEIDPVKSGVVLTSQQAVELANSYGHSDNYIDNLMKFAASLVKSVDINELYAETSSTYLDECLNDITAQIDAYMGTELYELDIDNEILVLKKGFEQITLESDKFKEAVICAFEDGKTSLEYIENASEVTCPDFESVLKEIDKTAQDAYYTDDNTFTVVDEIVGCSFDVEQAKHIWESAQTGEQVSVPLNVTWPSVTGEELRNRLFHDLLGAMTTEFPASSEDRVSNVNLCASKVNGIILYPGEVFSYNDTVGKRTKEAGFKEAPAYVDGEVKTEVGGGACQVSSTIYAATLFAFLETVDRTCHQFAVSYMQMGTDATVAWPDDGNIVDFKFKNNKNYPIKIVAICDTENKNITVEIWGTLEDDDYMPVEFDNRYSWINTYDRVIEPQYDDRDGYVIKLSIEGDTYTLSDDSGQAIGIQTITHRRVYDGNGTLVEDEIVNKYLENIKGYAIDTYYKHPE